MALLRILTFLIFPPALFLIVYGFGKIQVEKRALPGVLSKNINVEKVIEDPSSFDKWIRPAANWLLERFKHLQPYLMTKNMATKLAYAGHPFDIDVDEAYGLQLLGILVGAASGFIIGSQQIGLVGGVFAGLLLGIGGIFAAPMWLDSVADDRQREISLTLPDVLGILVIAMQAGLGFDKALDKVRVRLRGPLKEELDRLWKELSLGVPREEAFSNLFDRNNSSELRAVVGALIQGHQLGSSISEILANQAEEMRARRIQIAKELGGKASPKIAVVTGMFMAPSIAGLFLIILVYGIIEDVGPMLLGSGSGLLP